MNPIKLFTEKWYPPAERTESFRGQTVLVTGANTGLGLEAAKKIAALEADKLIITTRSENKGKATKSLISQWLRDTKSPQSTEIEFMILDMTDSNGVKVFADQFLSQVSSIDSIILNAGLSTPQHQINAEGFEQTLAVNAINTVYLATLLLPVMVATAKSKTTQTHMTVVSSRNATIPAIMPTKDTIFLSTSPLTELSKAENFAEGMQGGFLQYSRSKLVLEYALRRLSQMPSLYDTSKSPHVVINSVCPGVTKSDMSRNYQSWFARLVTSIVLTIFAKSASQGANAYLTALSLDDHSMGQMWANDQLVPEWSNLVTPEGQKLSANVWNELQSLMNEWNHPTKASVTTI